MFVAHDFNATKRKFQKPNILRKRSKLSAVKINATITNESTVQSPISLGENLLKISNSNQVLPVDGHQDTSQIKKEKQNIEDVNTETCSVVYIDNITYLDCPERNHQNDINIESFLNVGPTNQEEVACSVQKDESILKPKWCLDLIDNSQDSSCNGSQTFAQKVDAANDVPSAIASSVQTPFTSGAIKTASSTLLSIDSVISRSSRFKCDEPNCNKNFWTEQRLKKHKESHRKPAGERSVSQIPIECPVRKLKEDGPEESCGRMFLIRDELSKHLANDHTIDEAAYRCAVCARQFFWASGLRAHAAAHSPRTAGGGSLACPWPGCGRIFRQPCRLREHARAHTGDRPYLCRFPNCSWAFRSASKLMRHARRHTGDRRHGCTLCGQAFLRREHLRDHTLRKHTAHLGGQGVNVYPCTWEGCQQSFTNMSSLYAHMKKVHKNNNQNSAVAVTLITSEDFTGSVLVNSDETSSVYEENANCSEMENGCEVEGKSARTHCPWPLRAAPAYEMCPPADQLVNEGSPMEPSEGSESNVYTVRSDLFLHGNVLINEDNEFIVSRDYSGNDYAEGEGGGLIDAHPTNDLMQEELMYGDTTVDESSFRVFLLNGDELT